MRKKCAGFFMTLLLLSGAVFAQPPEAVISCDFPKEAEDNSRIPLYSSGHDAELLSVRDGIRGIGFKKGKEPFLVSGNGMHLDMTECSGGFYIRFDEFCEPTKDRNALSMGLFDCVLEKNGQITLTFFGRKTDLFGPFMRMHSRDRFETGKWYHIAWNYSRNKQKLSFFVDGIWQFENDNPFLPEMEASLPIRFIPRFNGALASYRFYEAPLDSAYLFPVKKSSAETENLKQKLAEAKLYADNSEFSEWLDILEKRLKSYPKQNNVTVFHWDSLERDIRNAVRLAGDMRKMENKSAASGIVTAYTVPAISQEIRTPYELPPDGVLSGVVELYAAQDEYESASFLVVPFQPVKKFHVTASPLKNASGAEIPASALDLKLVKRWFKAGGAWLNYHADRRGRYLTPDLLLNDDTLVRVDEFRQTNEIRLDYPEGAVYFDISRRERGGIPEFNPDILPFRDAPGLLPLSLSEAGRNQQYWLTVHVPENTPGGLYKGSLAFTADGKSAGTMELRIRVFPFRLPEARTCYDTSKIFYGNFSHNLALYSGDASEERILAEFKTMKAHNMLYPSGAFMKNNTAFEREVRVRKELGLPLRPIFAGSAVCERWNRTKPEERSPEVFEKEMSVYAKEIEAFLSKQEKAYGHRDIYLYGIDEASSYNALYYLQEPAWGVIKRLGGKVRATGMGVSNLDFVGDLQDMIVRTTVDRDEAESWHAGGALVMNYARPFPSAENPMIFRRRVGMWMYRNNYDGTMIHGFATRRRFNEFCDDYDGGNYRSFGMVYPSADGVIGRIALEGLREAFDDIRYVSLGKLLAEKARESGIEELVREGRRQLIWFSRIQPDRGDLDYVRLSAVHRIQILFKLYKKHGVKLP